MDVTGLRYCSDESLARRRRRTQGKDDGRDGELASADARLESPPAPASASPPAQLVSSDMITKRNLPQQLGTYSRSLLFVALTVLPPYLAARSGAGGRAEGGGWDDLRKLWCSLFRGGSDDEEGSNTSTSPTNGGSNRMSNTTAEQLRGRSRREIYERRRLEMVRMASRIESGGGDEGVQGENESEDGNGVGESIESTGVGGERGAVDNAASMTEGQAHQTRLVRIREKYIMVLRRLCRSGSGWFRQAYIATLSLPTAAHSISRNHMTNNDNGNDDQAMLETQADQILRWILRLNLALFYLNGRYPTLAHRIAGVRLSSSNDAPISTTAAAGAQGIVSPGLSDRPSYRMVGALILLEAAGALTGTANRLLVEIVHRLEMRRAARRQRSNETAAGSAPADANATAAAERSRLLDLVEQRAPSVLTYEQNMRERDESCSIDRIDASGRIQQPAASSNSCGICMNDRKHPAAPISCGHVFCWSCIIHWSTRVRPECPLCRAPAKPQDIIALYNY